MKTPMPPDPLVKPNHGKHTIRLDAALAGPLFMLSAALLFTLLNLCIKLLGPEYRLWDIGFYRFGGGALVLLTIFGRGRNPYRGNNIRLLIIRGCTGSAAFIALVAAIRLLPVSTALVIFYAYPAFAAVCAYLIYGERLGRAEMTCIAAVLAGVGVLFNFSLDGSLWGKCLALGGSAFAGLTVTLIRTLRLYNGPVVIYLYFCTMGLAVVAGPFLAQPVMPSTGLEWALIGGIVLTSLTAQLLMNQGFFYCRGWEGGVFMSSEVLFTSAVGILLLGDPVGWRFWLGGLMIVGGAVALNRSKGRGDPASPDPPGQR
jgi:drug/metabolite transporter (DMT)-like permease